MHDPISHHLLSQKGSALWCGSLPVHCLGRGLSPVSISLRAGDITPLSLVYYAPHQQGHLSSLHTRSSFRFAKSLHADVFSHLTSVSLSGVPPPRPFAFVWFRSLVSLAHFIVVHPPRSRTLARELPPSVWAPIVRFPGTIHALPHRKSVRHPYVRLSYSGPLNAHVVLSCSMRQLLAVSSRTTLGSH